MMAAVTSGCGPSDEFTGSWMGIDELGGGKSKVYQYDIALSEDGSNYMIRVTQFDYERNINNSQAVWRSTAPHFFHAYRNEKNQLVSDIGVIRADTRNFRLIYGNIYLVRKAKNTEVKFKYIVRNELEQRYPGIMIAD